ncbi:MAG: hypothetical protein NTV22_14200 [bacterium]|nr:hypothetical protein [bacterium]
MKKGIDKIITFFSLVLPPIFVALSLWGVFLCVHICAGGEFQHLPQEGKTLLIVVFAVSAVNTVLSILSLYLSLWKKAFRPSFAIISIVVAIYIIYLLYYHQCSWPAIQ